MGTKRIRTREQKTLTTEQKIAFVLLLFLGLGGVFFGFRSFSVNIRRPFDLQIAKYLKGERFLTDSQREEQEVEASKIRDVDGDGLTDYDELYVYKTSPYLTDSDSDGFDDKTEIFSNNDPNCPEGSECEEIKSSEKIGENNVLPGLGALFGDAGSIIESGDVDFKNPEDVEKFIKQMTLKEIRDALIKSGVPKEELDKIDDATLEKLFDSAVGDVTQQETFEEVEKVTQ